MNGDLRDNNNHTSIRDEPKSGIDNGRAQSEDKGRNPNNNNNNSINSNANADANAEQQRRNDQTNKISHPDNNTASTKPKHPKEKKIRLSAATNLTKPNSPLLPSYVKTLEELLKEKEGNKTGAEKEGGNDEKEKPRNTEPQTKQPHIIRDTAGQAKQRNIPLVKQKAGIDNSTDTRKDSEKYVKTLDELLSEQKKTRIPELETATATTSTSTATTPPLVGKKRPLTDGTTSIPKRNLPSTETCTTPTNPTTSATIDKPTTGDLTNLTGTTTPTTSKITATNKSAEEEALDQELKELGVDTTVCENYDETDLDLELLDVDID